ncbi:MAG: DUF4827 family protein [Paludibacteraceae bacterium]|nr:DUF4827 family protein [Paludibacteraceae bacterium]
MKKFAYVILFAQLLTLTACNNEQVYGNLLKQEKKLINSYIKRNNINIVTTEPLTEEEWGENNYYQLDDYLYYRLTSVGDTTIEPLEYNDDIILRYRRYTLDEYADTLSAWNTNDAMSPVEFRIGETSSAVCEGWYLAIGMMKYHNSECRIICPSKMGFNDASTSVTPYVYDLKIKIRR